MATERLQFTVDGQTRIRRTFEGLLHIYRYHTIPCCAAQTQSASQGLWYDTYSGSGDIMTAGKHRLPPPPPRRHRRHLPCSLLLLLLLRWHAAIISGSNSRWCWWVEVAVQAISW